MSTDERARAWVDVSPSALQENLQTIRKSVGPEVRILPMVKADAYGLGVKEAFGALEPMDPWGYGVAAVEEGLELREIGASRPILICSPVPMESYIDAVESGLTPSVSDLDGLLALRTACRDLGRRARFHLEIDTGIGRAGLDWRRVAEWGPKLDDIVDSSLIWEGCYTHFHSADGLDEGSLDDQWRRLQETVARLPSRPGASFVHACNSPGALRRADLAGDMVRPGIFLYGGVAGAGLPAPTPVASLRARIVLLKEASPGSTVGYGSTHTASGPERWATAAIGYGDGLPRLLGNLGEGVVRGKRAPIIGRISMDVTVLDVTGVPDTGLGDVVTFFGRSEGEEISVEEVADHAQTINYEILTGLTRRVPRIWTDDVGY
ncbi:MAG: alanine racemase [Gemmatimonadetes bacterium]|nr:alanine racemase [Gemmatimonadota bacterium]NNM05859.1 alanine racemase [Gemmatimonadota bacterium]